MKRKASKGPLYLVYAIVLFVVLRALMGCGGQGPNHAAVYGVGSNLLIATSQELVDRPDIQAIVTRHNAAVRICPRVTYTRSYERGPSAYITVSCGDGQGNDETYTIRGEYLAWGG
jgi:hypothetical protein